MFYLNGVGYKETINVFHRHLNDVFYLNGVGYKESRLVTGSFSKEQFYLNGVGYKVNVNGEIRDVLRVLSERSGI